MRRFIDDLKEALKGSIEPYLDEEVYIDEERLQPGYHFNEAIAQAICESICMILVYVPKYEHHTYCLREFQAMEIIEKKRLSMMADVVDRTKGLIIPIVFRGKKDRLPPKIQSHIHYCNFSKYTTASSAISSNQEYVEQINEIASYINDVYEECMDFMRSGPDLCSDCHEFDLPSADEVQPWRKHIPAPFPR